MRSLRPRLIIILIIANYIYFIGTNSKRRSQEVKRLNEFYANIVHIKETIQKCLKFLCQNEPYRMLKDWTYEMKMDPITNHIALEDVDESSDVNTYFTSN